MKITSSKKNQGKIVSVEEEMRRSVEKLFPKQEDLIPKKETKDKKNKGLFDRLWKGKKLEKPDMVAIMYLRKNGTAELIELPSKNGFFSYNNKQYHEREDCTYTITKNRYPLAIIREDGVIPEGTKVWWHRSLENKFRELQDQFINAIKYAELVKSGAIKETKLDTKTVVILVIVAIVGGAILMNYI